MKKTLHRIKKFLAFTLIELIVVIAIISILAAIIVIFIDPSSLFGNGRNGRRGQDLSTYQLSLSKFLADTPPSGAVRSLDSFVGMSSLYSSATSTSPYGNCPGLANGNTININGGYLIVDNTGNGNLTNNPNTINIQLLVDNGYLNGVILNPFGNGAYYACIDTLNNNQLVLYDPTSENMTTVAKPVINLDTTSLGSIASGSSNGGGGTNNSVSYNCPTTSSYSNGNCSPQSSYYSSILGTTGNNPYGIIVDSLGNIYTANNGSNNVSKITPGGVSRILGTTGTYPQGITTDPSGNIYTANGISANVSKITPGGVSSILGTTGSSPQGITIDSSGNIYTTNYYSANVSKITPGGVSSILGTTGSYPIDITLDSSGNIYTANAGSNNVSKITAGGVSSILGTTGTSPQGITIDSSGNIYTANNGSANVSKITSGGVSSILGTTGNGPQGIKIDISGNIYTANNFSNDVSKITPGGVSSILGTTGTGSYPLAITIDSLGNFYTANYLKNNVSKISHNPNGILIISPSQIKVGQNYTLGLNNVISGGVRVNTGTCSLQVTDTITTTALQNLSGNMNNGACKPTAFNAVTTTHPLSILATILASSQTFTYTTTPQ